MNAAEIDCMNAAEIDCMHAAEIDRFLIHMQRLQHRLVILLQEFTGVVYAYNKWVMYASRGCLLHELHLKYRLIG
jgi:hypothetical protein